MHCIKNCHRNPPLNIQLCSTLCFPFPKSPVFIWPTPLPSPPPPPPSPLSPPKSPNGNTLLLLSVIATVTLVAAIFLICLLFKKLSDCRRNRPPPLVVRRANSSDADEDGSIFDHHIWYINTVGLQQSVIDSIAMIKYKRDEKLIDGSDCSICLGEFQDDESLRLLPKCSHAFHVPCIDTWLRSHKNCPLCRAPVMSNPTADEPVTGPPPPVEEENRGFERENSRSLRRSVSMDLDSASIQISEEGSSSMADSSTKNVEFQFPKMGIGNQSLCNLVKSVSFGRSGRRKLKGAIHYRSQSSVLPL